MVKFVAEEAVDFNNLFGAVELAAPGQWDCDGRQASSFTVNNPSNVDFLITGIGFTYAPGNGNDPPTAGTIKTITAENDDTNPDTVIWRMTGLAIAAQPPGIPVLADLFAREDSFTGSVGSDTFKGFAGQDTFIGGNGADKFIGGVGFDIADYRTEGGANGIKVSLGAGGKVTDTFGKTDTLQQVEWIKGTALADRMTGDGLANRFSGLGDIDILVGAGGDDDLAGGDSGDRIAGGDGNDLLDGEAGADTIAGDDGNDRINGDAGADIITGGDGNDNINGGSQNDELSGNAGRDVIDGADGNDEIEGGAGDDKLLGEAGSDLILGGAGSDKVIGGLGADILIGGPGADELRPGEAGAGPTDSDAARDIIRFTTLIDAGPTAIARDEIFGFINGLGVRADRIDLSPIDANPTLAGNQKFKIVDAFTAAKGEVVLHVVGSDTIVEIDGDNDVGIDMTIRVVGVADLADIDFIL